MQSRIWKVFFYDVYDKFNKVVEENKGETEGNDIKYTRTVYTRKVKGEQP